MRAAHGIERLLSRLQSSSQRKVSQGPCPTSSASPPRLSSLRSRLEKFRVQMIRIIQTQPTPRLLKLLRRQALQRSLRGHGHENGQRHGAMWEVQRCCSRAGRLLSEAFVSDLWYLCGVRVLFARWGIRTEHFASSSYLRAEVVAGGTMSFSSSSEGIGEGFK